MSSQDRDRWNARYAAGSYGGRTHPCALLEQWLPQLSDSLPDQRALDLACGAGRNAIFLASEGFNVDAVDISAEALQRGTERAQAIGCTVNWIEHDLDQLEHSPLELSSYSLIVLVRYADLALTQRAAALLRPGGVLLVEAHLGGPLFDQTRNAEGQPMIGGPGSERFRLAPGSLERACAGLNVLHTAEVQMPDPDGRLMALAQFIGRAPS